MSPLSHITCFSEVPEVKPSRSLQPKTLSIHPTRWRAEWWLRQLLGGTSREGYHVCPVEEGYAVVREAL